MSARPDIFESSHRSQNSITASAALANSLGSQTQQPFQHVISLGPRCTNTSSVYRAQRKYAGPFDWIFSSARIVIDCVENRFASYLDPEAFVKVGSSFDSIGLKPGSAPRERILVGHKRYSEMTEAVGRGAIFNHHNPLTPDGYDYISRCAQRFLRALELDERKLYTFINIDRKLWKFDDVCLLFEKLAARDRGSFLMLVVNCVKHCGDAAKASDPRVLHEASSGRGCLRIYEVDCVGDNSGSYFKDAYDAARIQSMMVEPFTFRLSEDPLSSMGSCEQQLANMPPAAGSTDSKRVQCASAQQPGGRRWVNKHSTPTCDANEHANDVNGGDAAKQSPLDDREESAPSRSRWNRTRKSDQECSNNSTDTKDDGIPRIQLRRGQRMPALGLGTWLLASGGECRTSVEVALKSGYCLIDTAAAYKNEEDVGAGLRNWKREDVFVVTKLQTKHHGDKSSVMNALQATLQRLALDYVDLFLMHSPKGGHVLETWDAMLEARNAGLTKAVGVSNFGATQLKGLQAAGRELPEVNQVECHVWLQQRECTTWCQQNGIVIMAYSPLARGKFFGQTALATLAKQLECTEAELAIGWCRAKGFVVIPKSAHAHRIEQNIASFRKPRLTQDVMAALDELDADKAACAAASSAMKIPWTSIANGSTKGDGKGGKRKGY